MPKTIKTFITTDDTRRTYAMDGKPSENRPQLWLVRISISWVSEYGMADRPHGLGHDFYVERSTLEKLGMMPCAPELKPDPEKAQDELRETLEKLLSLVGIYPEH